mgnify:CR=1 FL=1
MRSEGSSPHARGTQMRPLSTRELSGIIPACAGNTVGGAWRRNQTIGIIPACAGNTPRYLGIEQRRGDHPRMRGEHLWVGPGNACVRGSSPHARGTLLVSFYHHVERGIIPACAGNTRYGLFFFFYPWDHPRMRGEHEGFEGVLDECAGSSPHARGTLRLTGRGRIGNGIIPACAGNTIVQPKEQVRWRDHPRMRGEHKPSSRSSLKRRGSSPHARGTPGRSSPTSWYGGIIPACAGNTHYMS